MASIKKKCLDDLLRQAKSAIGFNQPYLEVKIEAENVIISGIYLVEPKSEKNISGGPVGKYEIEIVISPFFPFEEPKVYETGKKIKREDGYHINGDDTCCICIWETWRFKQMRKSLGREILIEDYLNSAIRDYFFNQYCMLETGVWRDEDEAAHGTPGLINSYAVHVINCNPNKKEVCSWLKLLSKKNKKGHWDCPCGSGKKVRKCCAAKFHQLKGEMPVELARKMKSRIDC